jgi:hypothetical protein
MPVVMAKWFSSDNSVHSFFTRHRDARDDDSFGAKKCEYLFLGKDEKSTNMLLAG